MPDLADVLVQPPPLRLYKGRVYRAANGYYEITYSGGVVQYVSALDGATFAADDYVIFALSDEIGALILGKQTIGTPPVVPTTIVAPITVSAAGSATYDSVTGTWTSGVSVQSPTSYACWFYTPGVFTAVAGAPLATFEIELTRTSGGPPEFRAHQNSVAVGDLTLIGDLHGGPLPSPGVPTWITLPIDWGLQLTSGTIKGIAVGGGLFTGSYGGTGRLRITPV